MQAFSNDNFVPWSVRNKWLNYIELTKNMPFVVGQINREDNICADVQNRIVLSNSLDFPPIGLVHVLMVFCIFFIF